MIPEQKAEHVTFLKSSKSKPYNFNPVPECKTPGRAVGNLILSWRRRRSTTITEMLGGAPLKMRRRSSGTSILTVVGKAPSRSAERSLHRTPGLRPTSPVGPAYSSCSSQSLVMLLSMKPPTGLAAKNDPAGMTWRALQSLAS